MTSASSRLRNDHERRLSTISTVFFTNIALTKEGDDRSGRHRRVGEVASGAHVGGGAAPQEARARSSPGPHRFSSAQGQTRIRWPADPDAAFAPAETRAVSPCRREACPPTEAVAHAAARGAPSAWPPRASRVGAVRRQRAPSRAALGGRGRFFVLWRIFALAEMAARDGR